MNERIHKTPVTDLDFEEAECCQRGRIVVIDDDVDILSALGALFRMEGLACDTYESAEAYIAVLKGNTPIFPGPVCVLCDVNMPGLSGLDMQAILTRLVTKPVILMSGRTDATTKSRGYEAGAVDFIEKPFDPNVLMDSIFKALAASQIQ
jgi:FixJ family two-component response regulator